MCVCARARVRVCGCACVVCVNLRELAAAEQQRTEVVS